jgi:L-lysine exporter family protein LysE/ArgO
VIPLLAGFGSGASLIIAIGAQNAYVLERGLKRSHVFITAFLCTLCDVILISLGVGGMGELVAHIPMLGAITTFGGAIFLIGYGFRSFYAALRPGILRSSNRTVALDTRAAVLTVLAVSLLNPHVYLDTVILLGSIGAAYPVVERAWFAGGAMLASLTWFFGLAFGAARLTPFFENPRAWQILDFSIGLIMLSIAATLGLAYHG